MESAAPRQREGRALLEQIIDRAIEAAEEDRFGHDDVVERLIALVTATPTPASIALFGR